MSSTFIIGLIAAVLCCLLGYGFIIQSTEQKLEQKKQLVSALKQQLMQLIAVEEGIPLGLLTRDLAGLMYHCIAAASGQLIQLEPGNQSLRSLKTKYQQLMADAQDMGSGNPPAFTNSQDFHIAKSCLHELHGVIGNLQAHNQLDGHYARGYSEQVKELILQTTVEECFFLARKAKSEGHPKTEILHYQHAIEALKKANKNGRFDAQITQIDYKKTKVEKELLRNGGAVMENTKKGHSPTANGPQHFQS